jgi:hypothetical protein
LGPLRLGHQLFTHWSFLLRGSNCGPYFQFVIVYLITSYEHCTCHAKRTTFLVWQLIDLPVVAIDYPDDSQASMRIPERNEVLLVLIF